MWVTDRQTYLHADLLTYRLTYIQTYIHTDLLTDRETDRLIYLLTGIDKTANR